MSQRKPARGVTLTPRTLVILAVAVLLLVAGGVALGLHWRTPAQPAAAPFVPTLDPSAQDWTGDPLPDQTPGEAVGIQIPGYPSITLPADTQTVAVALLNPEGNPCYFTFELILTDTDEVLYTSDMVAPGKVITQATLARPLPAGEYNAVIRISTASLEDGSAMNGANVETLLLVQ